jgi:hypothetical protein
VESRSRIRTRKALIWSPRSVRRLRAAWVVHAAVGCAVTPSRWTRRVWTSITNRILWNAPPSQSTECMFGWNLSSSGRVRRGPLRGAQIPQNLYVEAAQRDGVEGEEVGGQQPGGLSG